MIFLGFETNWTVFSLLFCNLIILQQLKILRSIVLKYIVLITAGQDGHGPNPSEQGKFIIYTIMQPFLNVLFNKSTNICLL